MSDRRARIFFAFLSRAPFHRRHCEVSNIEICTKLISSVEVLKELLKKVDTMNYRFEEDFGKFRRQRRERKKKLKLEKLQRKMKEASMSENKNARVRFNLTEGTTDDSSSTELSPSSSATDEDSNKVQKYNKDKKKKIYKSKLEKAAAILRKREAKRTRKEIRRSHGINPIAYSNSDTSSTETSSSDPVSFTPSSPPAYCVIGKKSSCSCYVNKD